MPEIKIDGYPIGELTSFEPGPSEKTAQVLSLDDVPPEGFRISEEETYLLKMTGLQVDWEALSNFVADFVWICENCGHRNPRTHAYYEERSEAVGDDEVQYHDTCEDCARGVWDTREEPQEGSEGGDSR